MKLGNSIRRRRTAGRKSASSGASASGGPLRGLRSLQLAGAAVGVATLGLLMGWWVATRVLFPAPDSITGLVEVPDVLGRSLDGVEQALADAGLDLGSVEEYRHPAADSGAVVAQSPLAGQLALPGEQVRVTVSVGADRRAIPTISRLLGSQAIDVLRATGFTVAVDSIESDLPRGRVVEVDPVEGSALPLPAEVQLTVSLGPPSVTLPTLLGLSEIVARDSLEALGLRVGEVEEVFRFGRDQGRVVGQEPPGGADLERGTAIRLVVGRRGG